MQSRRTQARLLIVTIISFSISLAIYPIKPASSSSEELASLVQGSGLTVLPTHQYKQDVTAAILAAQRYVHAAFFFVEDYPANTVLDALVAAKERGVEVRLVISTHSEKYYPGIHERLSDEGIPFRVVTNHAKVVVIDDAVAYIGSANWNFNGLDNNWEMTYKSFDEVAIKEAKAFVGTMWSSGKTTVKSTGALTEQPVNGQEYVDQVLRLLKGAKSSIKFAMYEVAYDSNNPSSAHSKLIWELKNAYQRGVDVQILLDDPRYYDAPSGGKFLTKYKVPHKLDVQTVGLLEKKHLKAFLIDDSTLVIGSHNWNKDSAASSNEYSIIVRENDRANEEFKAHFEGIWNAAQWKLPPPS